MKSKQEHLPWHLSYQKATKVTPSWAKHGMPTLFEEFLKLTLGGGKHLDIGCGDGTKTINFALSGIDTTGIDISSSGFNNANKLITENGLSKKCRVLQSDCLSLPFDDNTFDSASDILMFTHLKKEDQQKVKVELSRVLKNKAFVLMVLFSSLDEHFHGHAVTSRYDFQFDQNNPLMEGFEHYQDMHNVHYTKEDILKEFNEFKIIKYKQVPHPIYPHRKLWEVIIQKDDES